MLFGKYCPDSAAETISGIVRRQPYDGDEEIGDRKYEVGAMGYCDVHTSYRSYSSSYDDSDYTDYDYDDDDDDYSDSDDDDTSSSEQNNQTSNSSAEESRHETVTEAPAPAADTPEAPSDDAILGSVIPSAPSEPVMPE
jgi:hypothetical protein